MSVEISTVIGARPQFIKVAVVSRAISQNPVIEERLIHTGQHYDAQMSDVFFEELEIPSPSVNLGIGSGTHGRQTARMLEGLEQDFLQTKPDWVMLYGDTNSTLAGALAAAKLEIPVMHVEAGVRSYNRSMPEEINRVLVDQIATILACPNAGAIENLAKEGVVDGVHVVGDVMLDAVRHFSNVAKEKSEVCKRLELSANDYYLATVHRPVNTDHPENLAAIFRSFTSFSWTVVCPVHPRTRAAIEQYGIETSGVLLVDPVGYLDMISLVQNARIVLTDSGGLQKEACWLGTPCVTLRKETEWTELVASGWNKLTGADESRILRAVEEFESNPIPTTVVDTKVGASQQIVDLLLNGK